MDTIDQPFAKHRNDRWRGNKLQMQLRTKPNDLPLSGWSIPPSPLRMLRPAQIAAAVRRRAQNVLLGERQLSSSMQPNDDWNSQLRTECDME